MQREGKRITVVQAVKLFPKEWREQLSNHSEHELGVERHLEEYMVGTRLLSWHGKQ